MASLAWLVGGEPCHASSCHCHVTRQNIPCQYQGKYFREIIPDNGGCQPTPLSVSCITLSNLLIRKLDYYIACVLCCVPTSAAFQSLNCCHCDVIVMLWCGISSNGSTFHLVQIVSPPGTWTHPSHY